MLQSFQGGGQPELLKRWPDRRTSDRRDRQADVQGVGLPGRGFGEARSLVLSPLTAACELRQVTPWGNPTLHVGRRSWDPGVHLVQVVSPVRAETRPQASGIVFPSQ